MLKKHLSTYGKRCKIRKTVQKPSKKFSLNRNRQEWRKNKKRALIPVVSRLCLVAEAGFEPHDLRVMSPTSYQAAPLRDIGAGNGSRTRTILSYHGILSPGRLPVPPLRRTSSALPDYYSTTHLFCQPFLQNFFNFCVGCAILILHLFVSCATIVFYGNSFDFMHGR